MLLRVLFALMLIAAAARAHDPGLSDSRVAVSNDDILVRLHVDPGAHASSPLQELSEPIRVSIDGRELPMFGAPQRDRGHYTARFRREPGRELRVEIRVFGALGADHKHYLRVEFSEPGNLFETILTAQEPEASIRLPVELSEDC
ncbi:MAG: hypothetical protein HKP27_10035 [Myxococcales bacterium]|nr:hypothetical protein [Myxococcales bacterium]